jgi:hypothetical protein
MELIDRINYYAKAVITGTGAVVTFGTAVVAVTKDGTLDGGDVSILVTAAVVLVTTVIGVIKKRNIDPPGGAV